MIVWKTVVLSRGEIETAVAEDDLYSHVTYSRTRQIKHM